MLNKWPVAGVLAGLVLFFWGSFTHIALNIEGYIKPVPGEPAVLAALQANLSAPGAYFFPNEMDLGKMEALVKTTPRGLLLYSPPGTPFSMGQSLGIQCAGDIVVGLLIAFLFTMAGPGLGSLSRKLLFSSLLGVLSIFAIQVPYWNWYGFPAASIATGLVEQAVGGLLIGFVLAKLLK